MCVKMMRLFFLFGSKNTNKRVEQKKNKKINENCNKNNTKCAWNNHEHTSDFLYTCNTYIHRRWFDMRIEKNRDRQRVSKFNWIRMDLFKPTRQQLKTHTAHVQRTGTNFIVYYSNRPNQKSERPTHKTDEISMNLP